MTFRINFAAIACAIFLLSFHARAVDRITASVTLTNAAGTTNGQTFTVNGNIRTWTNNVVISSSQILTNYARETAKTNLYKQIGLNPFAGVSLLDGNSTNFSLVGNSGVALTVSASEGYAVITYTTQTVSSAVGVRVPYTIETAAVQTNIASGVVAMVDFNGNTNVIRATAPAVSATLMGISNNQTVIGIKEFKTGIRGTVQTFTNGTYISPILTNGQNYGNAFSSPGSGTVSEQFGVSAVASGTDALAVGRATTAAGTSSTAIGNGSSASDSSATAVGDSSVAGKPNATAIGVNATANGTNSTAIGAGADAELNNQIALGAASQYVSIPGGLQVNGSITNAHFDGTNTFPAQSDISFGRFAITSLANGNNAGIVVGTNVFIEVSGPSSAFTINGIAGGRDGKFIIILNQTTQNMTIAHDSGTDPAAANRIYTMTGSDRATTGNGAAILIYSASASRWILISLDP